MIIELPDGRELEAPDGLTPEQIKFIVQKHAAPAASAPREDPSKGMSSGELRLAGIGRGMTNVGMNVADIAGRVPGLGGLRPSPETWEEFNRASTTLTGAERSSGAKVPVSWLTGDPATDEQIRRNIEAQYGTDRPGAQGSTLGESLAVAPVAGTAGKVAGPLVGRMLPRALQVPALAVAEGATAGSVLAGPSNRAEGAIGGGLAGGALGSFLQAAGMGGAPAPMTPAPRPTGPLASLAERSAVRSTNADRTALDRALKGSEQARLDLGRFMLDEKMPLRSPRLLKKAAQRMQAEAGPEIGNIAAAADKAGATVDLASAVAAAKASPQIAKLNRNSVTRSAYNQITEMLDDQLQQHGGQIPPSVAHDLRMQLDELAEWDRAAPAQVVKGWRAARDEIADGLEAAMQSAGLGKEWATANRTFSMSRKLSNPQNRGLADVGTKRREGNRLGSPSEKGSAILGAATAAAVDPVAGVAIPAATVALNRFFFPASARTLNMASRMTQPAGAATLDPEVAALIAALRARRSPLEAGLRPAMADNEGESP